MAFFLIYMIKTTLCLTLFYLCFKVFLSKETFFRFNRFVLLTGMAICMLLPLFEHKTENITLIQTPILKIEEFLLNEHSNFYLSSTSELPIPAGDSHPVKKAFRFDPGRYPGFIYCCGFFFSIILLFISIGRMSTIITKGKKIHEKNHIIVIVQERICPFSWGKYIVLSEFDYLENPQEILTHERNHIRAKHSYDLAFAEMFTLLHWFNPAVWLLKKELQYIHEYEADMGVLNQGIDATKYQLLLVKKAVGARSYTIANSFNHSKIKKRITMMLKRKSTHWARLKLLLFVPLAAATLQAFARPEIIRLQEASNLPDKGTTIPQEEQKWTVEFFNQEVDNYIKGHTNSANIIESATKKGSTGSPKYPSVMMLSTYGVDKNGNITSIRKETNSQNKQVEWLQQRSLEEVRKELEEMFKKTEANSKDTTLPFICIKTVAGTPADKLQELLNMLGYLYQARKNEINRSASASKKTDNPPFLVIINGAGKNIEVATPPVLKETRKFTPRGDYEEFKTREELLKETKKFTPPVKPEVATPPVLKETKKFTPPVKPVVPD